MTEKFELTAPEAAFTEAELETLAEMALSADQEAKEAAERAKALKDELKAKLDEAHLLNTDFKGIGHVRTIVKHVRRFDEATAREALTAEEIEKYSVKKLDSDLLKKNYAPAVYEELFSKDYGYSIELKIAD